MAILWCRIRSVCSICFFKQKTAYEMRISDWSSDVCSSDLLQLFRRGGRPGQQADGVAILPGHHGILQQRRTGGEGCHAHTADMHPGPGRQLEVLGNAAIEDHEIGRASCRERVCQYV